MAKRKPFLSRYIFSNKVGRYYRRSDGRLVPPSEIEKEVRRLIRSSENQLRFYGEQLDDGEITLRQWQNLVADEVRLQHTAAAVAARGGVNNIDANTKRQISGLIKEQITYLNRFANQIGDGEVELTGAFYTRLSGYAQSAYTSFRTSEQQYNTSRGATLARRVLSDSEHCRTSRNRPGCVEEANKGWQAPEEITPIGKCTCLYNCHCTIEYDNAATPEEIRAEGERIKKLIARRKAA